MHEEDDLLPISGLQHLLYCERRAALIHMEQAWAENLYTAEGKVLHEKVHEVSSESRGDVRISRGLRLRSLKLGLSGMSDVMEFHRLTVPDDSVSNGVRLPGSTDVWLPYPVEYKRGEMRNEQGYRVQICAQAMCLEEMLGCHVEEGAIYFVESARRMTVRFDSRLREMTAEAALGFHRLVELGVTPPPSFGRKCPNCSLVDICLPKAGSRKHVSLYLEKVLADSQGDGLCESS